MEYGALSFFPLVGVITGEREIGAEFGQRLDHLDGAAVGMEEKAAGWPTVRTQEIVEPAPGTQAMDADREVAVGSNVPLPEEDLFLVGQVMVGDPAVESDFADGGRDMVEMCEQEVLPVGGALVHVPRMIPEAGDHA